MRDTHVNIKSDTLGVSIMIHFNVSKMIRGSIKIDTLGVSKMIIIDFKGFYFFSNARKNQIFRFLRFLKALPP